MSDLPAIPTTRALGQSGITISSLAWGMWRFAGPADTARQLVDAALDIGITLFDTADIYGFDGSGGFGDAENLLGELFAADPGLRGRMVLASKGGIMPPLPYDSSAAYLWSALDASLKRLGVEQVDLWQVHRPDLLTHPAELAETLAAMVESGKVRAVGVSNFRPYDVELLAANMRQPLVANQIEISLAALDPFTNGDLAFLQRSRMLPMAWSPLAGGALLAGGRPALIAALREMAEAKGTDIAALAVAWLLAHPAGIVPVMGTNTLDRIATLDAALKVDLDLQDWFILYSAALGHDVP